MKSSQTRLIYEKYQTYQKTMAKSDGLEFKTFDAFKEYFLKRLKQGIPIECMEKNNNSWSFHSLYWDDMGTEGNIYDDMIIFADPADTNDHYQNEYEIMNATFFFSRFHGTNTYSCLQCFLCFPNQLEAS